MSETRPKQPTDVLSESAEKTDPKADLAPVALDPLRMGGDPRRPGKSGMLEIPEASDDEKRE